MRAGKNTEAYKNVAINVSRPTPKKGALPKRLTTTTPPEKEKSRQTRTAFRIHTIAIERAGTISTSTSRGGTAVSTRSTRTQPAVVNSPSDILLKPAARKLPTAAATIHTKSASGKKQSTTRLAKRLITTVLEPAVTPLAAPVLNTRRATHGADVPKPKMYKQTKAVARAASPPLTIAASRSRRSIKPNPKYASEDMVTPRYVAALSHETGNAKRSKLKLFADDDALVEDNDDELTDAAYNPQHHKSDDDDDELSENEYEQELRREKAAPVKRGRGRPPKSANTSSTNARTPAAQATAKSTPGSARSNQPTNLQQLRRSLAANMGRNSIQATLSPPSASPAAKRKFEESTNTLADAQPARKRMATEPSKLGSRTVAIPTINGSTKVTPTAKPKIAIGSNLRGGQAQIGPATKQQRMGPPFKITSPTDASPRMVRINTSATASGSKLKASSASSPGQDSEEHTFTIVNIDNILNQDDVLISRSTTTNAKKLSTHTPNRASQLSALTPVSTSTPSSITGSSSHVPSAVKRPVINNKIMRKQPMPQQHAAGNLKPQPRILNAEISRKTQPMKPLMSMGKELRPMTLTYGDTEEEDESELLDDETMMDTSDKASKTVMKLKSNSPISMRQRRVETVTQPSKWSGPRRNVLSSTTPVNVVNNRHAASVGTVGGQTRKLAKLLNEGGEENLFKKPASPCTQQQLQQRRSKENSQLGNSQDEESAEDEALPVSGTAIVARGVSSKASSVVVGGSKAKNPKYFPPETTTISEENGRIIKKITSYETWHVISLPKDSANQTARLGRTCLEMPLINLANVAARIKVPSLKWTSKVTLYKLPHTLMERQTSTIYTGDLKTYNIPEEDRHKYQPSCVLFRRSVLDRSKCRVPYDRAIIFKNKSFYANIEGKHVNLIGAPEEVTCVKDVEILLDIVDSLSLASSLVEPVTAK